MWCIERADERFGWDDFPDLTIHTGDYEPSLADHAFSKHHSTFRTVPDFNFHAWAEVGVDDYEQTVRAISECGRQPFRQHKAGWIGNVFTCPTRQVMLRIAEEHPSLFDVVGMHWTPHSGQTRLDATRFVSLPELVGEYSMLIDIEGNGYSGRLKYLLWSHRPLLLVERPHHEFFFDAFQPWVHYIPVERSCADLVEKVRWCVEHYSQAMEMAERAYEQSRLTLTRDACYAQWDSTIAQWRRDCESIPCQNP